MQIASPPTAPHRGGYLNSPSVAVDINDSFDWRGIDSFEWQNNPCACASTFPPCQPHTKSTPHEPGRGIADSIGIEASFTCTPPFSMDSLAAMATTVVEQSTENWVAKSIADQIAVVANVLPGPYSVGQGYAVALQQAFAANRGIIHATPYNIGLMLERSLLMTDPQGNIYSAVGGHSVIANPHLPETELAYTGQIRVIMSTIDKIMTFDQSTNKQLAIAERYLVTAPDLCGAVRVTLA